MQRQKPDTLPTRGTRKDNSSTGGNSRQQERRPGGHNRNSDVPIRPVDCVPKFLDNRRRQRSRAMAADHRLNLLTVLALCKKKYSRGRRLSRTILITLAKPMAICPANVNHRKTDGEHSGYEALSLAMASSATFLTSGSLSLASFSRRGNGFLGLVR